MSAQSDRFRVLHRLTEIRFEDELRGYSKSQVDRVLETLSPLAEDVQDLQDKLAAAERRVATAEAGLLEQLDAQQDRPPEKAPTPPPAENTKPAPAPSEEFDETLRKTLVLAQRTADSVVREANNEAEQVRASAQTDADGLALSSRATADRLLAEGHAARAQMMAAVEGERDSLLLAARGRAHAQIETIEAELSTVHAAQRQELVLQIAELRQIRDLLADDIDNFEGYLAERRETVRAAMSEINVVLDDPTRIRPSIPPQATDVGSGPRDAFEPIKVELQSLNELDSIGNPAPVGNSVPSESPEEASVALAAESAAQVAVPAPVMPAEQESPLGDELPVVIDVGLATEVVETVPGIDLTDKPDTESDKAAPSTLGGDGSLATPDREFSSEALSDPMSASTRMEVSRSLLVDAPAESEETTNSEANEDSADMERPAWADSVPEVDGQTAKKSADPFLDELRKATSSESEDDEALSRFMSDELKDSSRGGWFGRRR